MIKGNGQLLLVVGLGVLAWLIFALKEIILLLVLSYIVSYIIHPWVTKLQRCGISRTAGVLIIGVIVFVGIGGIVGAALPFVVRESGMLLDQLPSYLLRAKEILNDSLKALHVRSVQLPEIDDLLTTENFQRIFSLTWNTLFAGYSAGMWLISFTLLPFFVFYITVDFAEMHRGFVEMFPMRYRLLLGRLGNDINKDVSAYIRGQFLVATALFILYAIFLKLLGVELWLLLALISGYGSLVPYLGLGLGVVLTSLVVLVSSGDLSYLLVVWAGYGVIQLIEGFLLTPNLVGRSVGLSPLIIIVALLCGASLAGILGMVLAVPVAASLRVIARYVRHYYVGAT